jgi:hypothetical protein
MLTEDDGLLCQGDGDKVSSWMATQQAVPNDASWTT